MMKRKNYVKNVDQQYTNYTALLMKPESTMEDFRFFSNVRMTAETW